ncbi:MAG: hypothetical protein EXS05_17710, partial [Planctomycetaceae bacterium]|nr:hypothetical protein [Planctomycetaceae bacterium]
MADGGQIAIRGFLVQTLIALLDAVDGEKTWLSLTLEPSLDTDKVDILWRYPDRIKAVQVKSTQNTFSKADIETWANELAAWKEADEYELLLIGTPASDKVASLRKVGKVKVPKLKNLDLDAFQEQAAHRLDKFLRRHGFPPGEADYRMMLAEALCKRLATYATKGKELTNDGLVKLLKTWIPEQSPAGRDVVRNPNLVRIIRIYVSAPDDVLPERDALEEVVGSINRTDGVERGFRLETLQWKTGITPQIGPGAHSVIDAQTPAYEIYLGILATRFGP